MYIGNTCQTHTLEIFLNSTVGLLNQNQNRFIRSYYRPPSAETISGRCRRGHLEKSINECMYVKIILINKSKS